MHLPILDISSNEVLKTFEALGGCFVALPKHIQSNLELIKDTSDRFFALQSATKQEELKTLDNEQGYLDQSDHGYAIERYIFHGDNPKNNIMNSITDIMSETRDYLRVHVLQHCLNSIMQDLGFAENTYQADIAAANNSLSIIYYPAQEWQPDRLPAHEDASLLTVLWAPQQGLQAYIDGKWRPVETPPGYVIVQIGGGLKEWTNHQVTPLLHRVVIEANQPRTSIVSFAKLKSDAPFQNLITKKQIAPTYQQYIKDHLQGLYEQR